jgi:hypothetical protein
MTRRFLGKHAHVRVSVSAPSPTLSGAELLANKDDTEIPTAQVNKSSHWRTPMVRAGLASAREARALPGLRDQGRGRGGRRAVGAQILGTRQRVSLHHFLPEGPP